MLITGSRFVINEAADMALEVKSAAKDITELQSKQQEAAVHKASRDKKITAQRKQQRKKPRYRCKGTKHTPDESRLKNQNLS